MAKLEIRLLDDTEWPSEGFAFELPVRPERCALGVIDVQRYCIDPETNLARVVRQHSPALFEGYTGRVTAMLERIQELQSGFRAQELPVFYTRHGAFLPSGDDLIVRRRGREALALDSTAQEAGHMPGRGDPGFKILDQVAPRAGELVLDKNTSSAFHTTPLDLLLRNMGVETIVLTGVAADMCVLTTALDAADRGFHVILVSDACATFDEGSAQATQLLFSRVFGYVRPTTAVLDWLTTGDRDRLLG